MLSKLFLVLSIVALPVASAFVVIPSSTAAPKCDCSHLKVLQHELRIAMQLQKNFQNKIPALQQMPEGASQGEFSKFVQGNEVRSGVEPSPPGYKGPQEVDYDPYGKANLAAADDPKNTAEKLCSMTASSIAALTAAMDKSACTGIGEALKAHENVHMNFCKRVGIKPYMAMHGADRAREEAEAYGAQIKVLRDTIAKLHCGYRVSEQIADTKLSGIICSLEKPFTITGSNPVMGYSFEYTPSSVTTGTWNLKTSTSLPIKGFGSGTYTIEGANTDTPRLVMGGSSGGHTPVGTVSKSFGPGASDFKLIPLDSDECSQSAQ